MAEYFEEEFIFDILSAGCKKYNIFALICGDNNQTGRGPPLWTARS